MYRMTPFDDTAVKRSTIVRRKNAFVRIFDPVTARMSGWIPDPEPRPAPDFARVVSDTYNANASGESVYARMTVAELFPLARSRFGMRVTTKTRKSELVRMLSA